jgi:hypothetical protein
LLPRIIHFRISHANAHEKIGKYVFVSGPALNSSYHRDAESTERTVFLPDRETAIRQKDTVLWALFLGTTGSMPPVGKAPKELSPKAMALFPGRRLPARENIPVLRVLCVSVVNLLAMPGSNILVRSKGNNHSSQALAADSDERQVCKTIVTRGGHW